MSFTKVLNEQAKKHGRTKDAVHEAIRTAVEMCQDFGMTFMDAVEKSAAKF